MMGRLEDDHEALVDKTSGGLIVLPGDHVVIRRRRQDWQQIVRIGRSRLRPVQLLHGALPALAAGPSHRAAPRHAEPGLQPRRPGERPAARRSAASATCAACIPARKTSTPRTSARRTSGAWPTKDSGGPNPPFNPRAPAMHLANRKAPMARLMQKLGLPQFHNTGPLREELLPATKVGIALKQHVGAPCVPVVAVGDRVTKGQVLGRPLVRDGKPALGAPVHASIDGRVTALSNGVVWIVRDE